MSSTARRVNLLKTTPVILSERGPERLSVRGWRVEGSAFVSYGFFAERSRKLPFSKEFHMTQKGYFRTQI
jgi:hypothetical protein